MITEERVNISSPVSQIFDPALWDSHHFGLTNKLWATLNKKSFWVLGAGTGYGRCISLALIAAGAQVFISGRRKSKLIETIAEAETLGLNTNLSSSIEVDITKESSIKQAVDLISTKTSHLYGLVHCAAIPQSNTETKPLQNQSLEEWTNFFLTNVTGQWLASKTVLPLMLKGDAFRILFLSSEAGWANTSGFGPYNVCKSAVNTLAASFAAECSNDYPKKDVQINTLVPGEAHTEMNQNSKISPFSIVSMVLKLLSQPAKGPNGCFFHRDGRHLPFAYAKPFNQQLL